MSMNAPGGALRWPATKYVRDYAMYPHLIGAKGPGFRVQAKGGGPNLHAYYGVCYLL